MRTLNVVITGANSGIGLSTTRKYLSLGHTVYAYSRKIDTLLELQKQGYPGRLIVFKGDVCSIENLFTFYGENFSAGKKVDVLIANAGLANAQSILDVSEASYDMSFNTNVKGLFFTVQKAMQNLATDASIVLIGSIQANKGNDNWAVYGATKAAVRSLARSFAESMGKQGIRVNCLSPGVTKTPIFEKFGFDQLTLNSIVEHVESSTPLGRLGQPDEIANAIYFLCSAEASFITGADIQVDGGLAQI